MFEDGKKVKICDIGPIHVLGILKLKDVLFVD